MKLFRNAIIIIFLLLISNNSFSSDLDILYQRYWDMFINNPSKTKIDACLSLLNKDGSFTDLDYTSTGNLGVHIGRLNYMAGAFQTNNNFYYHSDDIKTKYYNSLEFWINKNQKPKNWWLRHVAYSKLFGVNLFLMNVELKSERNVLFNKAISYLRWAYLQNNYMNGANGADKIYGALPASILTKNTAEIKEYKEKIKSLIIVQNQGEGIETDWMYAQHSGYGRQLYANYEHEFLNSVLSILKLWRGTVYNMSDNELSILDSHIINASQWYVYNNHQDPCQTGRRTSSRLNGRFIDNLNTLLSLNSPANSELKLVSDRINHGKNASSKLVGNRMFWRFDYMIHRRENYFVSSRLTSTRTVGLESGNGQGTKNYYGGSGLNFILRTGYEYADNFFAVMNYRQWPGITVEQGKGVLPLVDWGRGGSNANAFAGGVSDGAYGAIGTIYSKRNVLAYKSWFYFDDEYIALGAGINQKQGSASVFTTVNQCIQKSDINYYENNAVHKISKSDVNINVKNPKWILQDSIGYVNLSDKSDFIISSHIRNKTKIFTLGVDHDINPKDADYAYAVYPNTSAKSLDKLTNKLPFIILSNTTDVQAVYHSKLNITQAIFYKASSIILADGNVLKVSNPCAIIVKYSDSEYKISISNPLADSSDLKNIVITITRSLSQKNINHEKDIIVDLPQGDYSGQSVDVVFEKKSLTTSINNNYNEINTISVFPNPAHENIKLSYGSNKINSIEILNLKGQTVYNNSLSMFEYNSEQIDVSKFNNGIYFIKCNTDKGVVISKLIKY